MAKPAECVADGGAVDVKAKRRRHDAELLWQRGTVIGEGDGAQSSGRVHLVGIAGSGMRSLAHCLTGAGWALSGSDPAVAEATAQLPVGARLSRDAVATAIDGDVEFLVHSHAVNADHVELRAAKARGIPTLRYAEAVGGLSRLRRTISVAGTHGKTTVSWMLGNILQAAGWSPTVIAGGKPIGQATGGVWGRSDWLVVEACEYGGNFLELGSEFAVVLGVEPDHFDWYPDEDSLIDGFAAFLSRSCQTGAVLMRAECRRTAEAARRAGRRGMTFGARADCNWRMSRTAIPDGGQMLRIDGPKDRTISCRLGVGGRHNAENALAAAATASEAGVSEEAIREGLEGYAGVERRLEVRGSYGGVTVVDDYAHHPTEVSAGLETVRGAFPGRTIHCVFQPHQRNRTERLLDELAASLQNADRVSVVDVFAAREAPCSSDEECARELAERTHRLGTDSEYTKAVPASICRGLESGHVLLTMGAGDLRKLNDDCIRWLGRNRSGA